MMGAVVGLALLLSIATVLNRQYKAMEQMALTSGTAIASFVANNVALRAVENAGLAAGGAGLAAGPGVRRRRVAGFRAYARSSWSMPAASCAARPIPRRIGRPLSRRRRRAAASRRSATRAITATGDGDFRFVRTIRYAGQPFGRVEVVVDQCRARRRRLAARATC